MGSRTANYSATGRVCLQTTTSLCRLRRCDRIVSRSVQLHVPQATRLCVCVSFPFECTLLKHSMFELIRYLLVHAFTDQISFSSST